MNLSKEQLVRMSRLLDEAIDLDEAGRRKWLEALPLEHQDLKEALREALLPSRPGVRTDFPGKPALSSPLEGGTDLKVGDRVGPYLLTHELGKGGMSRVWLAARVDGALNREVALKVPALSVLRHDLVARFAVERDILAGLEHPNIARLYDAGVTSEGLPYLALEYVRGNGLVAWADEHRAGVNERIELFLQILEAVQYAHDRGVLHRDIKPSNVLVTDTGKVRLLDFGVARLLERPGERSLTQVYGQALTPDYASPEHIRGAALRPSSDVYSLGMMLYELLAGSPPYCRLAATDRTHILEEIANRVPAGRPSTQVGTEAAQARAMTRKRLARQLRGDLDAIVLKAMAQDPNLRYPSAEALADDLRRYLHSEAVRARSVHPIYLLTKLAQRYRPWISATGVAVAIVALAGAYTLMRTQGSAAPWSPDSTAVRAATIASPKSIAVLPFVDMSERHDQEYFSDGLTDELIDRLTRSPDLQVVSRTSSFAFKGRNEDVRSIAAKLGVANLLEGSVRRNANALRIRAQLVRAADGLNLWSQTFDRNYEDIIKVQAEIAETVATSLRAALDGTQQMPIAPRNMDAYNLLLQGNYFRLRNTKEDSYRALEFYKKAIDLDPTYALAWAGAGGTYAEQAYWGFISGSEGSRRARAALAQALKLNPNLASAHERLGYVLLNTDWDWDAAREEFQRALALDPSSFQAAENLAFVVGGIYGKWDGTIDVLRKVLARDPLQSIAANDLALVMFFAGRYEDAAEAARHAILINPSYASAHTFLAYPLLLLGRSEEAHAAALNEADELWRLQTLALTDWTLGRRTQSDDALKQLEAKFGDRAAYNIAEVYAYRGEINPAFQWLDRGVEQRDSGMQLVRVDPLLQNLKKDPRYRSLVIRMKLDQDEAGDGTPVNRQGTSASAIPIG